MTSPTFFTYNRDGTFIGSPTVLEYQHEHMEGPYTASFVIESGQGEVDDKGLWLWFDTRLMTEFACQYEGTEQWRGVIWEMQLEIDGELHIKSMDNMYNAVKVKYTNTSGNPIHTGWFTNDESIEQYGRKERIIQSSSSSGDEAAERAEAELLYSASPYTMAIGY